jgi:hypothetical protein
MRHQLIDTPIGTLQLVCEKGALIEINWENKHRALPRPLKRTVSYWHSQRQKSLIFSRARNVNLQYPLNQEELLFKPLFGVSCETYRGVKLGPITTLLATSKSPLPLEP